MAFIKINDEYRITVASSDYHCGDGEIEVVIPEEVNTAYIHEYLYKDGEWIYDPLPEPEPEPVEPTAEEVLNALLGVEV